MGSKKITSLQCKMLWHPSKSDIYRFVHVQFFLLFVLDTGKIHSCYSRSQHFAPHELSKTEALCFTQLNGFHIRFQNKPYELTLHFNMLATLSCIDCPAFGLTRI